MASGVFLPRAPGVSLRPSRRPAASRLLVSTLSRGGSRAPVTLVSSPVADSDAPPVQYRFTVNGAGGVAWRSDWSATPIAAVAPDALAPGTTYDVVVETRDALAPDADPEAAATAVTSATLAVPAENQPPTPAALAAPTPDVALGREGVVPLVSTLAADAEGDDVAYRFSVTDATGGSVWRSEWSPYPVAGLPADGLAPGAAYTVVVETQDALGATAPTGAPVTLSTPPDPPVLDPLPAPPPEPPAREPAPAPEVDAAPVPVDNGDAEVTVAEWADRVLARLAVRTGFPEEMVATREHRLALVAWAKSEGGGVGGHCGRFNPLNTKKLDADLGSVKVCRFATVDYPSIDAGVEAAVRTMRGRYQNRVVGALTNPLTTAEQVLTTLASWNAVGGNGGRLYPTNRCWACPGTHYLDNLLRTLASVRNTKSRGWYGDRVLRSTPTGR